MLATCRTSPLTPHMDPRFSLQGGTAIPFIIVATTQIHIHMYVHAHPTCLSKTIPAKSRSEAKDSDLRLHGTGVFLIYFLFHCSESAFGFLGGSFAPAAFSSNFLQFSPAEFCPNSRQMFSLSSYETFTLLN